MEIGFIGLGRMGGNMAIRLVKAGHRVLGSDPTLATRELTKKEGVDVTDSVASLAQKFTDSPRIFWAMVPAGAVTESVLKQTAEVASPGDILIDGGNSNYKDSRRRGDELAARGLHFLDCGTSGGVWGLQNGYCLMVGGPAEAFAHVEPILRDLAPPDGYLHAGSGGAGHFAKMVHNGIEYGMLQAYAEGFELLHAATEYTFDLGKLSHLWNQGSVVRSWLLELAERAFAEGQEFEDIRGYVQDSGEGRWTVQESIERAVPTPVITLSLQMRFRSRQEDSYGAKVIAALRNQFGGHAVTAAIKEAVEPGSVPSGGEKDL
jgi:6-phosphogluconate dehydrogenase